MSNTRTQSQTRGRSAKTEVRKRTKRISMSGSRMRMHIEESEKDPNFHYSWINDSNGLVQRAKMAGYQHCTRSEFPQWGEGGVDASDGTTALVSMDVGGGTIAYLMKQPMEYHLEDQADIDQLTDAREADLKRVLDQGNGTYGTLDITKGNK